MTITGGSALPKEEIDRMVKEAEAHAAEDKQRREDQDTRNSAEQTVYAIEKLLKDEADKVSEDTRSAVQTAVDKVKEALQGEDTAAVKTALDELNEVSQRIGQEIYQANAAKEAAGDADANRQSSADSDSDDDVVEAEVVDDEEQGK